MAMQAAIVLTVTALVVGCGDSNSIPVAPPPPPTSGRVLTTIKISTGADSDSVPVGRLLSVTVQTFDQNGQALAADIVQQVSDTTIASLDEVIETPWDYGGQEVLIGGVPGKIVFTATATFHGVSLSATKPISILPSDSGTVSAMGGGGLAWHYAPGTLTVTRVAGDATVTWNLGWSSHSVHWDSQPPGGAVADIDAVTDGVVLRPFTVAGTYEYHCLVHPEMTGAIVVR